MDDVAITELEKIDATRVDGVGTPANGIPILLMKSVAPEDVEKDWADWDAAHEGAGNSSRSGNSAASAADAVARAKATIAAHRAGKKVDAADLKNAHEVHEAHLAHLARLKAEGKEPPKEDAKPKAAAKPAASKPATSKPAASASKKEVAKGTRDCPECDKSFDADHEGSTCTNCGAKLPDAPAAKSELDETLELVKAIVGRKVDETPDIAGGTAVIAQIADLIIAEAQELKAGNTGEINDIFQLAQAAELMWSWRTGEESVAAGSVQPATTLKSEKHNAADRKKLAEQGNALSDGTYPIADEEDLKSAAILAQSGHGDVTGAKRLIARRAKELKVSNPLESDDDAAKSQIAKDVANVDTVSQETGGLSKAVEDAVTKAVRPLEERLKALDAELAKVRATPVPGGPMISIAPRAVSAGREDQAAKAAKYRQLANDASHDPALADGYRQLARQAEEKAAANA